MYIGRCGGKVMGKIIEYQKITSAIIEISIEVNYTGAKAQFEQG
jgi:hypothetical protein|tara:strand:+ start:420 stop:551 length:132 start_codon:yes stop_codon:yes gene_type:complete